MSRRTRRTHSPSFKAKVAGDFTLSGTTLEIAAGAATSTGVVRIMAVDNSEVTRRSKTVRVSGTLSSTTELKAPFPGTLTIKEDDRPTGGDGDVAPPPAGNVPSAPCAAAPDAPMYLRAVAGDAQATLTWEASLKNVGPDITGYSYRYKQSRQVFGYDAPVGWNDIPGGASARSYTVANLTNGLKYTFEVRAENANCGGNPARASATLPSTTTSAESGELPTEVALLSNWPNPFNPETSIGYELPQAGEVRLAVYDLLGREVAVLVDNRKPAGRHTVRFHADNLPSGSYVYRLEAPGKIVMRTMMLVK